jgi:two-component system, chemotaxis family, response regulator Rcp1
MRLNKTQNILVIEESPIFQEVIREALGKISPKIKVYLVNHPQEALKFLDQREKYASSPRPQLILLNGNQQEMGDREFLTQVKSDDLLKIIPVIVLTDSDNWDEILSGYQLHANCYVHKPTDLDDLFYVVEKLGEFWLKFVQLP